jgi:hypothetical protein
MTMAYPPTIIGKFTQPPPEPEPPKYETLADVPEGIAIVQHLGAVMMRTAEGRALVLTTDDMVPHETPWVAHSAKAWKVRRVLGPITAIQFGGEVQP